MNLLYAPWRQNYIKTEVNREKEAQQSQDNKTTSSCVFCDHATQEQDKQNYILKRFKYNYVLLNLYPYNAGHLLVIPFEHKNKLYILKEETQLEHIKIVSQCCEILEKTFKCDGINVGLNMGKASGGTVPEHLHTHALPRWVGDTNFLSAIADTKPISFNLQDIYNRLKPEFDKI